MMKKYIYSVFLFVFFVSTLFASEPLIEKKKAPLAVALPLLKSIDHNAIVIGTGPIDMYAFIDPLCPRSQDFVSMIVENKKMQKRYTYHFFYYELKRFNSKGLIAKIYEQDNPLTLMKKIMIEHVEIKPVKVLTDSVQKKIDEIAAVAIKLDIYKRPYLFVVKPNKGGE
jgi:hypothetical protein